ncbi:Hypothetical protein, putative [Bodo saltans]|uniref:Uncharacterized protein n=1 Tax=Bodo saltans TaxID=75058 RepID=A0A0S4J0Y6_BODSA|nr:Hypothetical protein, putative [Bodo saltans]|eukprot:CUG06687.1 Hypothetical protein, putative [Bodo saltans]
MRRICNRVIATPSAALVAGQQVRSVYSIWGSVVLEEPMSQNKTWAERITSQHEYRSFINQTIAEVPAPSGVTLSATEQYLLSAIEDDTKRLLSVDWTFDFDPFWRDRVQQHVDTFTIIYTEDRNKFAKIIFGNSSSNKEAKLFVERKLNVLKATIQWAEDTERVYSAIANARFHMQREVFDAFEREKILAGCVEIVDDFKKRVPVDFSRKAVGELDNHLMNMRHWIWDCPNAKRTYSRRLA